MKNSICATVILSVLAKDLAAGFAARTFASTLWMTEVRQAVVTCVSVSHQARYGVTVLDEIPVGEVQERIG